MPIRFFLSLFFVFIGVQLEAQVKNVLISSDFNPNEVSIAINPKQPNVQVAASNLNNVYYSTDSGKTWVQTSVSCPYGIWGDPILVSDANGTFYYFHLTNPSDGTWIDRLVCQRSEDGGKTWTSGVAFGLNGKKKQDKEGVAVNPKTGELYVTWTQFDAYGSKNPLDSSIILFAKSADRGETWSTPKRISYFAGDCLDSSNTVEGAVPAAAENGEIFVSWSGPKGIVFQKSINGGETWLPMEKIIVPNHSWTFNVPGIYRCNGFPQTLFSRKQKKVSILYSDQSKGSADTEVWLISSFDEGETWGKPLRINQDAPGKHQFFSSGVVDESTGKIWVMYYDRRNYPNTLTDVFLASISPTEKVVEQKISQRPFQPTDKVFFGDYSSIAVMGSMVRPMWTRLDQGALSVWTALVEDTLSPVVAQENVSILDSSSPTTFVSFKLKRPALVRLTLVDMNGRLQAEVIKSDLLPAGKHIIPIHKKALQISEGLYYYVLEIEGLSVKKKLLTVR